MRGAVRELPYQAPRERAAVSYSDRNKQNAAWRRWYRDNAKRKMGWQQRRREEIRAWWRELKATKRCERCGEADADCLHFHHRDAGSKDLDLARAATNGWSRARILGEVAKCDVLCANCHLKHHWDAKWRKWSG